MIASQETPTMETPELSKHTAAPAAAGFLFQFQRAVQILAEAPNGATLGIETLDDLTTEYRTGEIILEQDKFTSNRNGAVFSDVSCKLLGTLTIWLTALLSNEISPETTSFLLVTNDICHDGLVYQISNAKKRDTALKCLEAIQAKRRDSEPYRNLMSLLDNPRGREMFLLLCQKVELVDGVATFSSSANKVLSLPTSFETKRGLVFETLCGWIHTQAIQAWSAGNPCKIAKQAFVNQLDAILNDLKRTSRRERPESQLPVSADDIACKRDAVFVRQIGLVTDDESYKTDAICDFLRCVSEKTRLNGEGEISDSDWLDFEDRLERRGKEIWRRNNRLSAGESEEITGFRTMTEVLDSDHHPDLAGEPTTQTYLANGTYHSLSDEKTIGWHPRYLELIGNGEPDEHPL